MRYHKSMYLVLACFIAFFALFSPSPILAHSQVAVIEMTPNGFEPQEVTIDEYSSVIFINKDTEARWPASNVHPTHEIYPEFDPRKVIAPGKSWPFKPKKNGEWKYHDHMLPHMRGVIVVVAEENQEDSFINTLLVKFQTTLGNFISKIKTVFGTKAKSQLAQKKQLPNTEEFKKLSYETQEKKLQEIARSNGATDSWQFINGVFKGEGGTSGNIHDLAHLSGTLLYEEKGFDGIAVCTAQFAFGCYHGFLDRAFAKNLDHLLDAENACLTLSPNAGATVAGPAASCIHGIGHGVASFYLTEDLKKALTTCRKLLVGKEYCFDGVFMEFARSAPVSFYKKGNPLYPCDMLEKEFGYAYSFSCGRNQPALLMSRFSMGFDEVIPICRLSDSKPFQEACFDSLGFSLAATGDVVQITAGCRKLGTQEYTGKCLKAAAGELVFQEVPGWQEKSKQVCSSAGADQNDCQGHIERLIREYGKKVSFNFRAIKSGEDINSYVREQIKICYGGGGRDGCYKQVAGVLYDHFGLAKTLDVFKRNEEYPEVYARCHEVTHYLSRLEYEKQQSISGVYAQCDSTCHGGCYHGTLEAYLKESVGVNQTDAHLAGIFPRVCGKAQDYQKPIEYNECLHGMGHAAMFVTDMELLESLKLCDTLSEQEHKERCYTGVFMENSSSSTSFDHASRFIKKDDPFYPCNSMEEKYQSLCWQYQSSYFAIIVKQDWKKVADLCLQIPAQYQDRCFRTIGTNQVGFTPSLEIMKKDCDLMPSNNFKNICVAGVVSSLSYRFVGDMQKMIDFCAITDTETRESCFKQIGSGLLDWDSNRDIAKRECGKIPDPAGKAWCESVI